MATNRTYFKQVRFACIGRVWAHPIGPLSPWIGPQGRPSMRHVCVWILSCIAISAAPTRTLAAEEEHRPPRRDATQQKDLSKRLIRESATASEEDVMDRLMRLMSESARRLEIEFDAGEETQAVQQQIAKELDDAIKMAASRIHKRSPRDSSAAGEMRRRSDDEAKRTRGREPGEQQSGSASSESSTESAGAPPTGRDSDTPFRESRRSWGNLPQRQREEVLQGIGEQFLERYRDWIERYYRALQESEE